MMGHIGVQELIIIFVIALLVFGPKKLPELGKSLGKGLREFRKATDDLKTSWDEQVRQAEREAEDISDEVQSAIHAVGQPDPTAADKKTESYTSQPANPVETAIRKEQA